MVHSFSLLFLRGEKVLGFLHTSHYQHRISLILWYSFSLLMPPPSIT